MDNTCNCCRGTEPITPQAIANRPGLPALGKVVLTLCMLFGRLEVFTGLVVFFPAFWRK